MLTRDAILHVLSNETAHLSEKTFHHVVDIYLKEYLFRTLFRMAGRVP